MMKKIIRKIHLWLSIPFGLILTIVCFTGACLVFEKEITRWLRPELVETAGGRHERLPFFDTLFRLHRWLLDSPSGDGTAWGKLIVGVSTLALVLIVVTGVVMWLTHRPLTASLRIHCRKGWFRFWHDLHVAGGVYTTVFLLAFALTGLTWSFSWYRTGFYRAFGVESSLLQRPAHGGHGQAHGGNRLARPNSSGHPNPPHNTDQKADSPHPGQEKARQVRRAVYQVHTGSWGGMPTRILTFLAALVGTTLPLTGYYLWFKKRARRRR